MQYLHCKYLLVSLPYLIYLIMMLLDIGLFKDVKGIHRSTAEVGPCNELPAASYTSLKYYFGQLHI